MERLALGGHLGFGGIAGAAPLAELGLQRALACLQGLALRLVGLLLLFPLLPLAHQGLNRRHEALFIAAQGLELALQPLGGQGPLPPLGQQLVTPQSGLRQGAIGALQLLLQLPPAGGIAGGLLAGIGLLQGTQLALQGREFRL